MTGLLPDSTKVYDLVTHFRTHVPNVVTLGQHFKQNGYYTVSMGKIRVYEGVPAQGDIPPEPARNLKHGYYACISFTDANVGKILDELEKLELADNTIVVLWGDHGWKLGEHNAWCKHTNFENDARAPLIIRAPGQKAPGRATRALVEFVDIYPTLCDLAGLAKPAHLEGSSAARLLDAPENPWKTAAFSQYPRGAIMGYSMKTDRYRFTAWRDRKTGAVVASELYDHETDPDENENIAVDSAHADLVVALQSALDAGWRAAVPPM